MVLSKTKNKSNKKSSNKSSNKSSSNKSSRLRDPNTLKSGHVSKVSRNKYVVVKRDKKGKARYVKAKPKDVKCSKTLKKNVKEMINDVKTKKIKTYKQALAIAYNKTQKKFPKCELINKTKKKKLGLKKQKAGFFLNKSAILSDLVKNEILIKINDDYNYQQSDDTTTINKIVYLVNAWSDNIIDLLDILNGEGAGGDKFILVSSNINFSIANKYFKIDHNRNIKQNINGKFPLQIILADKGEELYKKKKHKKLIKKLFKLLKELNGTMK